jgi:hypothetical protein
MVQNVVSESETSKSRLQEVILGKRVGDNTYKE